MKYIKIFIAVLSLTVIISIASAAANGLNNIPRVNILADSFVGDACNGLTNITSSGCSKGSDTVKSVAKAVVTVMSIIIGVIAVIMILIAGIRFVTAGGDSNRVASAKNTLIYAIIGLFIAVIAQLIIHYVLSTANSIQQSSYLGNYSVYEQES